MPLVVPDGGRDANNEQTRDDGGVVQVLGRQVRCCVLCVLFVRLMECVCRQKSVYFFNQDTGESVWKEPAEGSVVDFPEGCDPMNVEETDSNTQDDFHDLWHDVYILGMEYEGPELCHEDVLRENKEMVDALVEQFKLMSTTTEYPLDMNEYFCSMWYLGHNLRKLPASPVRFDLILLNGVKKMIYDIADQYIMLADTLKRCAVIDKAKDYTSKFAQDVNVGSKRSRE